MATSITGQGIAAYKAPDDALSSESKNAVQNKVIDEELSDVKNAIDEIVKDMQAIAKGLPEAQKNLIITIMRNGLYSNDQSENINALEDLFFADIPATSITLNASSIALLVNGEDTYALVATVQPVYTTDAITWDSSNDTVATVSDNGLVTGIAEGTAIITATAGNVSASCRVIVSVDAIVSISAIYNQTRAVYVNDDLSDLTDDLTVTANYEHGATIELEPYEYTLSGTLTAGVSTITVTYGEISTTFNVTVSERTLDDVVYEDKTYRDIFMTGNMLEGTDFENGIPSGWIVNAGNPEIVTDDYVSSNHALKCFGSASSQFSIASQASRQWDTTANKTYYNAYKAKCTRYVKGNLGLTLIATTDLQSVTSVTSGWVTRSETKRFSSDVSNDRGFIGSYSSADLDGYIDDIVHICLSDLFTVIPSKSAMDTLYEEYCAIRHGGVS